MLGIMGKLLRLGSVACWVWLPVGRRFLSSLADRLPLLTASLVLDGRLVIGNDGDDLMLEKRRQAQSHTEDLRRKHGLIHSFTKYRILQPIRRTAL